MVILDTLEVISNIDNFKARSFCCGFINHINNVVGNLFDISINDIIMDEDSEVPFIKLVIDLTVKESVTIIYLNNIEDKDESLVYATGSVLFIKADPLHYNDKDPYNDLKETIRKTLNKSISKLGKGTFVDNITVDCSVRIEPKSFRERLHKGKYTHPFKIG